MNALILKLLGAKNADAAALNSVELGFRSSIHPVVAVILLVLMAALVWWGYRKSPVSITPWKRRTLTLLRILFLTSVFLVLMRPVMSLLSEGSIRRSLILLVDDSASMQIKDPRITSADQQRVSIAQGNLPPEHAINTNLPAAGLASSSQASRINVVKSALTNPKLNLLPRLDKEFDIVPFSFGQNIAELARTVSKTDSNTPASRTRIEQTHPWITRLNPQNSVTAIGDALRDVASRERGQPLAGIFLITDGANNAGSLPREAAEILRQEELPLYIYGVGITSPRDIIVSSIFAPEVAFKNDEVPITVRIRSQGLQGQSAQLKLSLDSKLVEERTVKFDRDGEQVIPMRFAPSEEGEHTLTASIDARPDETVQNNNLTTQRIKVIDSKIKVLMVEQAPRWEFRYLQALLLRDRRVDLKCILLEGDPSLSRGTNTPYLDQFPWQKDALFKYDLIIFGDVDPRRMPVSNLENLNEWVAKFGGALVVIAGRKFTPNAYKRSVLERMLPVELDSLQVESAADQVNDKPVHLELTANGRANPMMRLSDRDDENLQVWKQLPPIYWAAKVARPKPAAEVLLVDPDPNRESRHGKMPVFAIQHYGLGQVLYVGTDNTWRWRQNVGEYYYATLWGQMLQRITIQRLLGGSKRIQLTTDRQNFMTGERIALFARIYSAGYDPVTRPTVKGYYRLKNTPSSGPQEVILRSIPEQAGLYRGEFTAPTPGYYQFSVEQDATVTLDLSITEPRFEFIETAMNEAMLAEIATNTGGAFFREESLHRLSDTIKTRTEKVLAPIEIELWCSPAWYLIMLALASTEWFLRKRSQLK